MKKVLFGLAFVSFALVSCSKERDCVCTDEDGDKTTFPIAKAKKSDQEAACAIFATGGDDCELQ
ncbi:MAG: hypothetical protein JJU02_13795 [Cryomorphaceae bacterium]|nr:hypothetical protein [Cryomorphaceae bacterium]